MKKTLFVIIIGLLSFSMFSTFAPQVNAEIIPVLSVQPSSIIDSSLGPGSVFLINITVANVHNLFGYQFSIVYDTEVLTATSFGLYPPFENFMPSEIFDTVGTVEVAAYTYMGDWTGFSTIEPKAIAYIEFIVDDLGTSALDLCISWPTTGYFQPDTLLVDTHGYSIPHEDVDGFFDNRPPSVPATINIDSDTLNLQSSGKYVTCYIEPPVGFNAGDIDVSSIRLNGTIPVDTRVPETVVDYDNNGIPDLMIKFDRAMVESFILSQGIRYGKIALTVYGSMIDGTHFEGTDTVFVK